MSEQKMREALEWLADEMRSELTDDGASLPQWLVKSWLTRCTKALAEQPERSNRQFLTPDWIAAEDAAGGVMAAGALATSEQPAQGEAVAKAKLWDTLNAALMSRSGITLDNERDCYEAARQWAEDHDDASSYKAAAQKLREERDTIAALKVEAVTLAAPPAPAEQPATDGWGPWRDVSVHGFPESSQEVLFVRGGKVVHGAFIGGLFWHSNQYVSALLWMPFPEPLTPDHHRSLIAARLAAPEVKPC